MIKTNDANLHATDHVPTLGLQRNVKINVIPLMKSEFVWFKCRLFKDPADEDPAAPTLVKLIVC